MVNFTQVSYFTFAAYFDTGMMKYLCFLTVLVVYVLIVGANVLLVVAVTSSSSLHQPMYLFLCSLFVNELLGSAALFPSLLVQILSDIHTISVPLCLVQIFCVFLYANVELYNLSVMSYDRYLAICHPLQYNARMTRNKVSKLIALIWLFPLADVVLVIGLTSPLRLCGNVINKVYCDNYSVVKLACSDTTVNNVYGLVYMVFITLSVMIVVLHTYGNILKVCFSGSKQTRHKAVRTCSPQLLSLLNYTVGAFFEVIQSRFNMSSVPNVLRIVLSLYFLTCQPLFNPVLYGLNMSKIQSVCRRLLFS